MIQAYVINILAILMPFYAYLQLSTDCIPFWRLYNKYKAEIHFLSNKILLTFWTKIYHFIPEVYIYNIIFHIFLLIYFFESPAKL